MPAKFKLGPLRHRVSKLDDVFEVCGHSPDQFIIGTYDDEKESSSGSGGVAGSGAAAATSPTSSVVGSYNFR